MAILHAIAGTFIPLFVCAMLTRFYGARRSAREGLAAWPFALFAAFSFTIPYLLCAVLLGPEFPSLMGGAAGMAIVVTATRRGWFVPHEVWDFPPRAGWDADWSGSLGATEHPEGRGLSTVRAWAPYGIVAALLLVTRLPWLGIGSRLAAIDIGPASILDSGIGQSFQPFYSPGFMFILTCLVTYWLHGMTGREILSFEDGGAPASRRRGDAGVRAPDGPDLHRVRLALQHHGLRQHAARPGAGGG